MTLRTTTAKVLLRWSILQEIGREGFYNVFRSAQDQPTVFNFSKPLNDSPIAAWPMEIEAGKLGDGLAPDGYEFDGFGYGGFGDGLAPDGYEYDGFGGATLTYLDSGVEDGTYGYLVVGYDEAGNGSPNADNAVTITVAGTPPPPASVYVVDYNESTDELRLGWTPDPRNRIS